ncbi:MAG: hypothetical protein BWX58_01514 [Deltaproteobacteria bacterium ADurb.Bin026]|nr:MAG: hypothetical protein BWX58_01514 [Deltaproteobacteria bacterium ADurb.Bin026]
MIGEANLFILPFNPVFTIGFSDMVQSSDQGTIEYSDTGKRPASLKTPFESVIVSIFSYPFIGLNCFAVIFTPDMGCPAPSITFPSITD